MDKSGSPSRTKKTGNQDKTTPILEFSAERSRAHFQIQVYGKRAALPYSQFRALIRLLIARAAPDTGFVALSPATVSRLRRALAAAAEDQAAKDLIETGFGQEYRLNLDPAQLATCVIAVPTLLELENVKVISRDEAEQLKRFSGARGT